MSDNLSERKIHFYNLDVLRFVAAFMVIIFHGYLAFSDWVHRPSFFSANATYKTTNKAGEYAETFIHNFDSGVDFFFLISGFLITYLLLHEKTLTGKIHIGKFYFRRILRIWPLYFLLIAIAPWWNNYVNFAQPGSYKWNLLFANNFQRISEGKTDYPFIHYWSLCIEEHFYLIWPLLLLVIPSRKLIWCLVSVIFISIAFRMYAFTVLNDRGPHIFLNTLSRMDILSLGGIIAWVHFYKPIKFSISKPVQLIVLCCACLLFFLVQNKTANSLPEAALKKYLFNGFFVLLLLNYLFNEKTLLNFRKKNILHYLGKISYGLYMFHNLAFLFVIKKIIYAYDLKSLPVFWICYLSLTIAASAISYQLLEKPLLKLKERFALIKTSR